MTCQMHLSHAKDAEGRIGCNDCGTVLGRVCGHCGGAGATLGQEHGSAQVTWSCPRCGGWGWVRFPR